MNINVLESNLRRYRFPINPQKISRTFFIRKEEKLFFYDPGIFLINIKPDGSRSYPNYLLIDFNSEKLFKILLNQNRYA